MLVLGTMDERKDLVPVSSSHILYHTAIVGQSGSGKSYFLARLLEEIVLKTRARILILDPNGDFSHFHLPQEKSAWASPAFEALRSTIHSGQYPGVADHDSYSSFAKTWNERKFQLVQAGRQFRVTFRPGAFAAPLFLHWKWLQSEQDYLLTVNPHEYSAIYQGMTTCIKYAAFNEHEYPQGFSLEDL
jgi:GTPase SAR1 family protein